LRVFVRHRVLQGAGRLSHRILSLPKGRRGPFVRESDVSSEEQRQPSFRELHADVARLLPAELNEVVLLLALGLPISEVARLQGIPPSVVRGQGKRAGRVLSNAGGCSPGLSRPAAPPGVLPLEALVLQRHAEGWSDAEIAHAARIRPTRVKSILRRARRGLLDGART
jgi:DNA-directed RNA polymerase specialized sigma24 family protein